MARRKACFFVVVVVAPPSFRLCNTYSIAAFSLESLESLNLSVSRISSGESGIVGLLRVRSHGCDSTASQPNRFVGRRKEGGWAYVCCCSYQVISLFVSQLTSLSGMFVSLK